MNTQIMASIDFRTSISSIPYTISEGVIVLTDVFLSPGILTTLDVSDYQILCYHSLAMLIIVALQLKLVAFLLAKNPFSGIRSTVLVQCLSAFSF
jgi:hypothetical protein